ncbi:hypothetical protein RB653_003419 [Dictyostelium firmibasis]|uniref:Fe2OG dioxygenase domain-containing protein n=1 Tax=Dictyostelium firmibasis TaxID=79012 RepID=A0AAN7YRN3_9MYCE
MENHFKKSEPIKIEGLTIIENAIDKKMHDKLWKEVIKEEWLTDLSRRTQHYGYKYNYKSRKLKDEDIAPPLPQWAVDLCSHLMNQGLINDLPQQLIVNEYKDNQGISAHIDSKIFDNTIFSISLGSACRMIFKKSIHNPNQKSIEKPEILKIEKQLLPCTFLLIKDEARYNWTHEIPKLKKGQHRISLTFRFVSKPSSPHPSKRIKIDKSSTTSSEIKDEDEDEKTTTTTATTTTTTTTTTKTNTI